MPDEAQQENNPHRGKAGVLASIQASRGTINLKGELGQGEKEHLEAMAISIERDDGCQ